MAEHANIDRLKGRCGSFNVLTIYNSPRPLHPRHNASESFHDLVPHLHDLRTSDRIALEAVTVFAQVFSQRCDFIAGFSATKQEAQQLEELVVMFLRAFDPTTKRSVRRCR
jgi:hypothetical protein